MSDWMIIPDIENALIVFVEDPGDSAEGRTHIVEQLREAAATEGTTPYIFYSPPEMGEEINEWLAEFGERFAFAAQMPGSLGERMKFAFRRVLSRNTVKKAVIIGIGTIVDRDRIAVAFEGLERHDLVLGSSGDGACVLIGLRKLHTLLLDDVPWESPGTMAVAKERIISRGLSFVLV